MYTIQKYRSIKHHVMVHVHVYLNCITCIYLPRTVLSMLDENISQQSACCRGIWTEHRQGAPVGGSGSLKSLSAHQKLPEVEK